MKGILYLEDGTIYRGVGFGAQETKVGELVFNTAMTGYQKTLTDPSYSEQIITMTYPLIGNYGINDTDYESDHIFAFGLVCKDVCFRPSNWKSVKNIDVWLKEEGIPGIYDIDTRELTRKVRNSGTMKCVISTEDLPLGLIKEKLGQTELNTDQMKYAGVKEVTKIKAYSMAENQGPGLSLLDEDEVTERAKAAGAAAEGKKAGSAAAGTKESEAGTKEKDEGAGRTFSVAVLDLGVKRSILKELSMRGCDLTLYPYGTKAKDILASKPDGVFVTNGPGDPEAAREEILITEKLITNCEYGEKQMPVFGICMGHQIIALAQGGKTYKLKYGHRGCNHGVFDKSTGRSYITSQNHGYAVQAESVILHGLDVTHLNLNDGTVEGMKHISKPLFSVQFHPESSPGPDDTGYLFDRFIDLMKGGRL